MKNYGIPLTRWNYETSGRQRDLSPFFNALLFSFWVTGKKCPAWTKYIQKCHTQKQFVKPQIWFSQRLHKLKSAVNLMITVYLHIPFGRSMLSNQDSGNNLTPLCYSSKTRRFRNYSCMNQWKSRPSYSTWVRVEYITFILKNSPNIRFSTRYSTQYLTWGRVTRPQSINFTTAILLKAIF